MQLGICAIGISQMRMIELFHLVFYLISSYFQREFLYCHPARQLGASPLVPALLFVPRHRWQPFHSIRAGFLQLEEFPVLVLIHLVHDSMAPLVVPIVIRRQEQPTLRIARNNIGIVIIDGIVVGFYRRALFFVAGPTFPQNSVALEEGLVLDQSVIHVGVLWKGIGKGDKNRGEASVGEFWEELVSIPGVNPKPFVIDSCERMGILLDPPPLMISAHDTIDLFFSLFCGNSSR